MATTFRRGQLVRWPPAPGGVAQVVELRRTRVRLHYACRTGRVCRPVVPAADLARLAAEPEARLPLPLHNPFGLAAMGGRAKEFRS